MSMRALSSVALLVLAAFTAGMALRESTVSQRLTIAAGPDEGEAYALATAIAEVAERHYPRLVVEVVETSGSSENMRLLEEGRVELATVQADTRMGPQARMLALLYPDVFQLIVREDSGIRTVADLVGKRIALPPEDGGQYEAFWFLAEHYELDPADLQAVPMSAASAGWALADGSVDATFRVRAAGNPAILELIEEVPTRLVPIVQAAAMQLKRPALQRGTIPTGSYRGHPPLPESDLPTVAVQRLLIAREDLDDGVVDKVTRVLFERRRELMNLTSLAGFIAPPSIGGGTFIPVHSGAQRFYDRDQPSFIQQNAESLALVVTLAALLFSGLLQLGSRRKKRRIDLYNKEVLQLGARLDRSDDLEDVHRYRVRLFELAAGVVDDAEVGLISPDGFNFFWFTWNMVNGMLEQREAVLSSLATGSVAKK
ncbi:MAG: TAXI family TRAP transporter solute-binding subunit [Gemmatimonadales bacterium]